MDEHVHHGVTAIQLINDHASAPQDTRRGGGCICLETRRRYVLAFTRAQSTSQPRCKSSTMPVVCSSPRSSTCSRTGTRMRLILRMSSAPSSFFFRLGLIHGSVYNKTLEYVKTFAKFSTTDSASAVREYVSFLWRVSVMDPKKFG